MSQSKRTAFLGGALTALLLLLAAVFLLPGGPTASADMPPPFPLLVDPVTSPTELLTQTITGEAAPGALISIVVRGGCGHGGGGGQAGADGHFAVEIRLLPATLNRLTVTVIDPITGQRVSTTLDRHGHPLEIMQHHGGRRRGRRRDWGLAALGIGDWVLVGREDGRGRDVEVNRKEMIARLTRGGG